MARIVVLMALALIAINGVQVMWVASSGIEYTPAPQYGYPSPSYWPVSPYPMGSVQPQPQVTVLPCPSGEVATTAQWHGQTVPACTIPGGVPPDPKTGPVLASPTP